jgi:O-antigen/teichoic acid export membrane protein
MHPGKAEKALKGVEQLLLSRIASRVITFAFLIVFVRLLTREELAIIPIFYAASGASVLLFSFGIPATLVREVPRLRTEDTERMQNLLFTGFSFVLAGIFITSAIALIFHEQIKALFFEQLQEQTTYQLIVSGMVIGGWHFLMTFILKSLQEYKDLAVYGALYDLLQKSLGLCGYLAYGINGLLIGFILGGLICNLWFTWKFSNYIFSAKKILPLSGIIRFSWPFYLEGYLHYFRNNGDILVIGSVLGPSALAVFYVAKRLYVLLMMITRSIEDVVAPSLSHLLGQDYDSAIKGYSRITILAPIVLIPIGALAAGISYTFVNIVGGAEYTEQAFIPAAAFCVVAVIEGLYGIQARAIFVFGNPTERLKLVATQAAIYFPLLYILISQIGIIGAPVSQAASFIIGLFFAKQIISRIFDYHRNNIIMWKVLIASSIGLAILAGLQIFYYSVFILPLYFLSASVISILLFTILTSETDIELVRISLPSRLTKPFNKYLELRQIFRGA